MSNSPLPESGSEREIFLQALRLFSDECKPPDLIAECPFSVDLPGGGRGCGEECLDLLDRYDVSRSLGGIPIGSSEVEAHSMGRPTRPKSHRNSLKPFDAGEFFYRDSDNLDRSTWETVSLLYALRSTYLPTPDSLLDPNRSEKLSLAAAELRRRRFNVDELLRCGLRSRLVSALALAIVMPDLLAASPPQRDGEDESARTPELVAPPPSGWPELLDEYLAAKDLMAPGVSNVSVALHRLAAVFSSEFSMHLQLWAGTAPIDDLINWRPPTIDAFLAYDLENESAIKAACRRPLWMIDRFTETYLKDWDTDSLRLEWRFQHGSETAPCSRREMATRSTDINDLARTLAQASANPVSDKLPAIKSTAIRLLLQWPPQYSCCNVRCCAPGQLG